MRHRQKKTCLQSKQHASTTTTTKKKKQENLISLNLKSLKKQINLSHVWLRFSFLLSACWDESHWSGWFELYGGSHNRREPPVHEWSANLNEGEHSPVLPSNRETGCLSDTRIKMDALYFPPCSVREQGETEGEWKERRRKDGDTHAGGIMGGMRRGGVKEKQRAVYRMLFLTP